ncbi:MAG: DnaJ domain-containing protein [Alphaproteobacteria bacterium]|nr:DnaJ domain-containing protein [Alphaproteobacteria bacterium]MBP7759629.1 DnaJ domain-containing protein [Alphaproteobacteria bacterium]
MLFESIRQEKKGASNSNFSYQTRTQYLKILGLGANAKHDEVKVAYKELVRKHHPDILLAQGIPIERIKDSEEILKTINAAYNWLSNDANNKKRAAS